MILKTENLSHRYSSNWAIRDINIEIAEHGIIGLLGSNGAGKSTTMNIICGTLNQTEGNVYINGIDARKDPEAAKREIGFLPQTPPLYTDLTIDEYLIYCANLRLIEKHKIKTCCRGSQRALRYCAFQFQADQKFIRRVSPAGRHCPVHYS